MLRGGLFNTKSCSSHQAKAQMDKQAITFTPSVEQKAQPDKKSGPYLTLSLFGMGTEMTLNPCIPLATVLTVAATMATPIDGARLGIAFGLRTSILSQ